MFFTRKLPARVLCVYAFAFIGSIEGEVARMIPELALGAIARRCALRLPVPTPSGYSPLSFANNIVSLFASVLINSKTSVFSCLASSVSHARPFLCRREWKPIAPRPIDRSRSAENLARSIWSGAFSTKYSSTLSSIRIRSLTNVVSFHSS